MGQCTKYFQPRNMNKFAFVVCLAACVSADADAFYGPYGYGGLAYSGLAGYPYAGVSAYSAPYLGYAAGYGVSNVANSVGIAGAAPAAIPAGVVHVAKRSADAEPEADAAYLYGGYGYGAFGGAYPYGLGYNGFAGYPYGYPAVGYSAYYGKRSADAEPEADAYYGYYGYGAYPYAGYGYSAYRPYGLAYGYGRGFYY